MNVLIADDETLLRDAVKELIKVDCPIATVTTCASLAEAVRLLRENPEIELVVLDLYMPGMMGLSGAQEILDEFPEKQVVLMSGSASAADVSRAYGSKVHGFISKHISGRALVAALNLVRCGERYFPSTIAQPKARPRGVLSERERLVTKQLQIGLTNKSIAQSLGLDEAVVKGTIRSAGYKLGARTRTEIAMRAAQYLGGED